MHIHFLSAVIGQRWRHPVKSTDTHNTYSHIKIRKSEKNKCQRKPAGGCVLQCARDIRQSRISAFLRKETHFPPTHSYDSSQPAQSVGSACFLSHTENSQLQPSFPCNSVLEEPPSVSIPNAKRCSYKIWICIHSNGRNSCVDGGKVLMLMLRGIRKCKDEYLDEIRFK